MASLDPSGGLQQAFQANAGINANASAIAAAAGTDLKNVSSANPISPGLAAILPKTTPTIPGHDVTPATDGTTAPAGSTPVTVNGTTYNATPQTGVSSGLTSDQVKANLDAYNAKPSSSSTIQLNANANAATASAMGQSTGTGLTADQTSTLNGLVSVYGNNGVNISSTDVAALMKADPTLSVTAAASQVAALATQQNTLQTAKDATKAAQQNQAQQYADSLSQENNQFAQAQSQLDKDRQGNLSSATAQLASLNSSGGISSDSGQFLSHINAQYDMAQQSLILQGTQAKAALDAGNLAAYNTINQNMQATVSSVNNNIANILSSASAAQTSTAQTATTNQKDALTQADNALQNLPQPQQLATLPTDYSSLSGDQQDMVKNTEAFALLKKGGMSDQAAYSAVQTAATSSFKQQAATTAANNANTAAQRAEISAYTAQANLANKQAAAVDAGTIAATPGGNDYLSAFQLAEAGSKNTAAQNSTTLSTLSQFLQNGDTTHAKQLITNYVLSAEPASTKTIVDGLQDVAGYADTLKAKIAALPADEQSGFLSGNFSDIANKFGQNPSPQLAEIGREFAHLGLIYKSEVFGKRAAVSNDSTLSSMFPDIKDTDSLNFSTLDAMNDTANQILNGKVSAVIGQDTFNNIYGDAGVLGKGTSTAAPASFSIGGQSVSVGQQIQYKNGQTGTVGSDGTITLDQ